MRARDLLEKWSKKYKSSIDCSHPRGFSQRAHCQGRKKHNEDAEAGTQPTLMDALRDFFPVAMQHLDLDHLPRITFVPEVTGHHAPTFGKFMNAENTIFVDIENRHPNDILRTLAHELVHYRQLMDHQLDAHSGETGSDEENQANAQAGVIMRNFNQQYPEYLELEPVILPAKKTHISESHDATPAQQWSSPEERCKKKISEASDADVERMSQQWVEGYGSEDIAYNALISIREEIVFVLPRYCETYRVACDMRKQMQAMGSEKFHAWIIVTFTQDLAAAGWPRPHSDTFTDLTKRLVFKPLRGGVNPLDTLTEQIEIGKDTPAQQWIHKIYDEFHEHPFNPRYRVMTWGSGDDQELAIFELAPVFGKPTTVDIKWFQAYPQRQGIGTRAMQRLQQLALEHGITLTIYPWNRGEVSQSKLTKIYRGMGFRPTVRGAKDMSWQPQQQSVAESGADSNLSYQGNCTEDDVIEHIFGDVNNFANMVEEHGDEFTVGDLVVKYDPETDVHSFYYKKQSLSETFDQPYPLTWEHSEYGDVDALATLDDGTHLTVMFSKQDDDSWGVSFYRNDSQRTTGLGDAHRVFATVLAAIAEFIKKQQPRALTFSAVKVEEDDDSIQDQLSRIKLYDRLVQRYAQSVGYGVTRVDKTHLVAYKLTRLKQELSEQQQQSVAEGDVIRHKFAIKQAQKNRTPYYKNPDIEIPQYDPDRRAVYHPTLAAGQPEDFDHFEVEERSPTVARIIGITQQGQRIVASTTSLELANALVDAYNRGGFTDKDIQRVPVGPTNEGRRVMPAADVQSGAVKLYGYIKRNLTDLASMTKFHEDYNESFVDENLDNLFGQGIRVVFDSGSSIEFDDGFLYIPLTKMWTYRALISPNQFVAEVVKELSKMSTVTQTSVAENFKDGPQMKFLRAGELTGSYTDQQLRNLGFKQNSRGAWYIPQDQWQKLISKGQIRENFADGKKPGRKGLAKRMGVPTTASVSRLRQIAKSSTGERARMAHWMANMKSGKNK